MMLTQALAQLPKSPRRDSIEEVYGRLIAEDRWTEITGIFAYATAAGLLLVMRYLDRLKKPPSLNWLFGLDDCLTQPAALNLAQAANSALRVISLLNTRCRFHPKILHFSSKDNRSDAITIGSANLTFNGLVANAEAITLLRAQSAAETQHLRKIVSSLFGLGTVPDKRVLEKYADAYKAARPLHQKIVHLTLKTAKVKGNSGGPKESHESQLVGLDPTIATKCWIEVGKNTAQGRELEIKAEQPLFFGVYLPNGDTQSRNFLLSNGKTIAMNFKYQSHNAMWRLQMRNEVPEVLIGLRPMVNRRLGRSAYVAIFDRMTLNKYRLRFINKNSVEFRVIKKKSQLTGFIGKTTARRYGWS